VWIISQGQESVAIGFVAGNNAQKAFATAVGTAAGQTTQGALATAVGYVAGNNNQGGSAVAIGAYAGQTNQAANSIVISGLGYALQNTIGSSCKIAPLRYLAASSAIGYDTGTAELFVVTSSRDVKQDITPLLLDSTKVYLLEARSFVYKTDVESGVQSGYIAEEVADIDPYFATYSREERKPVQIHWNAVQVCVVEELKKLRAEMDALKAQVAAMAPAAPAE